MQPSKGPDFHFSVDTESVFQKKMPNSQGAEVAALDRDPDLELVKFSSKSARHLCNVFPKFISTLEEAAQASPQIKQYRSDINGYARKLSNLMELAKEFDSLQKTEAVPFLMKSIKDLVRNLKTVIMPPDAQTLEQLARNMVIQRKVHEILDFRLDININILSTLFTNESIIIESNKKLITSLETEKIKTEADKKRVEKHLQTLEQKQVDLPRKLQMLLSGEDEKPKDQRFEGKRISSKSNQNKNSSQKEISALRKEILKLENQTKTAKESLQSVNDRMESIDERLRSAKKAKRPALPPEVATFSRILNTQSEEIKQLSHTEFNQKETNLELEVALQPFWKKLIKSVIDLAHITFNLADRTIPSGEKADQSGAFLKEAVSFDQNTLNILVINYTELQAGRKFYTDIVPDKDRDILGGLTYLSGQAFYEVYVDRIHKCLNEIRNTQIKENDLYLELENMLVSLLEQNPFRQSVVKAANKKSDFGVDVPGINSVFAAVFLEGAINFCRTYREMHCQDSQKPSTD